MNYARHGRMTRRRFLTEAAILTGGLVVTRRLPALAIATGGTAPPKPELTSFSVGVQSASYISNVMHYVALEKGYLREAGFDKLEVIAGEEYLAGVAGGGLLMSIGDSDAIFAAQAKNQQYVYLACAQKFEHHLIGLARGINTAADLKGKLVAAGSPHSEFIGRNVLRAQGLDPDKDVGWIRIQGGSDAVLQVLVAGRVAGAVIQVRHERPLLDAGGKLLYKKLFVEIPQAGIFTRPDAVRRYPNTITAYMGAFVRACQYTVKDWPTLHRNKTEVLGFMEKNGFRLADWLKDAYEVNTAIYSPNGGFKPSAMDRLVEEAQQRAVIPQGFEWRKAVDFQFLYRVQTALGLPQDPKL